MRVDFKPPRHLRSPHVQTLLGSRGRKPWVQRRAQALVHASQRVVIPCADGLDGVQLEAWVAGQSSPAPTVILIHGWLGDAGSTYVLSAGAELWARGFSVIRLNLRDHGATEHLNEGLYNAARLTEVLDAVDQLKRRHATGPIGLCGFSLGGNFALRVCRAQQIPTVAICPALDPATTLQAIDSGWIGYRWFFVRKWHNALRRKQRAFPTRYQFGDALRLHTVAALTDLFVDRHTDFADTDEYYAAYTLTGDQLRGAPATIVYAEDDPVIPSRHFLDLPAAIPVHGLAYGGHCAFLHSPARSSWADNFIADHFERMLAHQPTEHQSAHN